MTDERRRRQDYQTTSDPRLYQRKKQSISAHFSAPAPRHLAMAHGLRSAALGPLMPVRRRTCLIAAVLRATGCAHPSCLHRDTSMLSD